MFILFLVYFIKTLYTFQKLEIILLLHLECVKFHHRIPLFLFTST